VVNVDGQSSKAMADQLTTVAKERLTSRLGVLSRADLKAVDHVVKIQLNLPL
jgi:mRNA interferase MazF